MADEQSSVEVPKRAPGVLVGVEWTKKGTVTFTEDEQNSIKDLLTKLNQRDSPARREEVIRTWEKRLFDRGFQHILPMRNGGWGLPNQGSGYGYGEENSKSTYETNIYNSYGQIIISALTREVPTVRFRSRRPDDDAGITAAQSAEALKEQIIRNNNMLALMEDVGRFLYVDGRCILHTFYLKDGQQFGYKPDPDGAVPENEEQISEEEGDEDSAETEQGSTEVPEESSETSSVSHEPGSEPEDESESEEENKEPNGREVIEAGGALEWKLPIRKNKLAHCGYAIKSREIDVQQARAMYPEVAEKIQQKNGGPGGDDLDRLARINVEQGMMDSYNTQDSQANDVTWQTAWIRPWQLLELSERDRDAIIAKVPHGLQVVFCGDTFCEARDQSMDDCLSLIHALPGDGMHRPALGDWLMPIQKVLNNWLELANDYFVRGVPATYMDNETFDVEAIREQVNQVGDIHPFESQPGVTMDNLIWQERPPQFPEQLTAFIQDFKGDTSQLLSGAFPALYGGDTESNDTMGGIQIQRDQALGRVGLPWRRIKAGIATSMMQAVQCLAENHDDPVSITGKVSITVEMADLKGDMYAYPDVDENFPETQTQKQNRIVAVLQDATTNPMLGTIVDDPDNLELVKDALGMEHFVMPALEARDKQLGEIELMLHTGPLPNPAIEQIDQQIQQLMAAAQQAAATNPQAAQQIQAQLAQLQQQKAQLPPEVTSVPIDERCDNQEVEAATTLRFINSPRGRAMKRGTKEEQESFTNIRLHYIAHDDAAKAKAAQAAAPPQQKPPSISANVKDMTPDEAAQALAQAGIKSDPQNIAATRATAEAAKHPHEQVPVVQ